MSPPLLIEAKGCELLYLPPYSPDLDPIGFTLGEIRTLLHGFPAGIGAAQRWQALASEKLVEVDEVIAQLRETRELLEEALRCECVCLDESARLLHQK